MQNPGNDPPPDDQHDGHEGGNLGDGHQERGRDLGDLDAGSAGFAHAPIEDRYQRRQQDQRQDHHEVLDDQPADGDAAALRVDDAAFLQGTQEHDGAGDRQGEAEGDTGADVPAEQVREAHAEHGGDGDLADGT